MPATTRQRPQRLPRTAIVVTALVAAALCGAPPASAGSNEQIARECLRNGYVDPDRHSREDLRSALRGLPQDIAEYTDCYDVISEALDAKRKRGGGGGGAAASSGGGAAGGSGVRDDRVLSDAEEVQEQGRARNEIESTLQRPAPKVNAGGKQIDPDLAGFEVANSSNELPLPILLALIAVALTFAGAGAVALWHRLPLLLRLLKR